MSESKVKAVKAPERTKRYTPPKVLQAPPPPVEDEVKPEEEEAINLPVQPYPCNVQVLPWGDAGIVLRLDNPISAGTFHLTWPQLQGIMRSSDALAAEVMARHNVGD